MSLFGSKRSPGPDPFESQVLTHLDALYGVACRLTKLPLDAEDLVQDALVKAMRARDQYQAGTNLKAWLFKILTNTFINRYRRGGLERSVLDGPDADPLADGWIGASPLEAMRDPESRAMRALLEKEIVAALDELPEEFRLAVVLSDVEELSYKEISDIMGCPIGTVMSACAAAVAGSRAACTNTPVRAVSSVPKRSWATHRRNKNRWSIWLNIAKSE